MAHEHPKNQDHDHESAGHGHSHSHRHTRGTNKKILVLILILSLGYMVAEILGGLKSGSLALLADAGHMALDAAAIALGLFAFWIARRPPDARKTFGYYRVEILAAAANAMTLVLVAFWIFYEAYERFQSPAPVEGKLMSLIAVGGLVVNVVSLVLMMRDSRESLNMRGVWLLVLTDALGSVAAIVAGFCVWQYGWTLADPIISVAIGMLILYGAWKLLVNCIDVLLVAVPEGLDPMAIRRDIEAQPGVEEVHDLHVWAMNTGVNSLSAHVRLRADADYAVVLQSTTALLRSKYGLSHATLQLEPHAFVHGGEHFCAPGRPFHTHG